jgi:hypothetical protein
MLVVKLRLHYLRSAHNFAKLCFFCDNMKYLSLVVGLKMGFFVSKHRFFCSWQMQKAE